MANVNPNQQKTNAQQAAPKRERKLLLSKLFTDAPIRIEPEEPQKVVVAGLVEAKPKKDYPDTFFGRANAVFRGELSTLFKGGLYFILFTLPFILVYAVATGYFQSYVLGTDFNFMGNIGVGYPGVSDNIAEVTSRLIWEVREPIFLMLGGAGIIASIGMAGVFYSAKRSYFQDYYKRVTRTYFIGIAKYWWQFLLVSAIGIFIALGMGTSIFYLLSRQAVGAAGAGEYCAVVFSFLIGAPLLTVPMVMLPLTVSYEASFADTFKNALVIIFNCPISVAITGLLSALPLLMLCAGNVIAIIVYILMALAGFSYVALNWIGLVNRGMVKCAAIKLMENKRAAVNNSKQKQKVIYAKAESVQPAEKKKKPQQQYQNPKKKKKK